MDKSTKQNPVTKSFRNLVVHIDDFKKQNGHTDILCPGSTFMKRISHSDGSSEEINMIRSLQTAVKTLKCGRVGMERKKKLKEKGVDLDEITIGGELSNLINSSNDYLFRLISNNHTVENSIEVDSSCKGLDGFAKTYNRVEEVD